MLHLRCNAIYYVVEPSVPDNTCQPSPCGPYSNCRVIDNHAVCSCQPNYIGSPPSCRPECVVSTDCGANAACINQRCKDPCPGTCGVNAECRVINHNPVCICAIGYSGDPFFGCVKEGNFYRSLLFPSRLFNIPEIRFISLSYLIYFIIQRFIFMLFIKYYNINGSLNVLFLNHSNR